MQNTNTKSIFRPAVEILSITALLFHALLLLGTWNLLPDSIPTHFGFMGETGAQGDKSDLLLLFGLSVSIYTLLTWIGRFPHKFNYPWQITAGNAARQYNLAGNFLRAVKCEIVWMFAIISAKIAGISFGLPSSFSSVFVPTIIAVTGLTGIIYMLFASRSAHENAS